MRDDVVGDATGIATPPISTGANEYRNGRPTMHGPRVMDDLEAQVSGEFDVRGCLAASPGVRVNFDSLDCGTRVEPATGPIRRVERLPARPSAAA